MITYPISMSKDDEKKHQRSTVCECCKSCFTKKNPKVRHHLHYIEKNNFVASLCNRCNLQLKNSSDKLTALFHNLSYDGTLIMKHADKIDKMEICKNENKIYSLTYSDIVFLDSNNIIQGSLQNHAENHLKSGNSIPVTESLLSVYPQNVSKIVSETGGKQSLPYEYLTSYDVLEEKNIPPKSAFYSKLTQTGVSDTDYDNICEIWREMKCDNLLQYSEMYLRADVGLLADIYLSFRKEILENFQLDTAYFLTNTSLSLTAFLKSTGVKLGHISSGEIYQLLSRSIRGGLCVCNTRYCKAHNIEIDDNFLEKLSLYILYLDFNSLYPTALSKFKMPTSEPIEMTDAEISSLLKDKQIVDINSDSEIGYFFLVDTKKVNSEIAEITDSLPLAVHHQNIDESMLSPHTKSFIEKFKYKLPKKNRKLIASHLPMKNHLFHLKYLQTLIKLGLEVEKVVKVYKFNQSLIFRDYIEKMAKIRAEKTSNEMKGVIKIFMNSLYGTTIKNVFQYSKNHRLCEDPKLLLKAVSKHNFNCVEKVGNDRYIITSNKKCVLANSPLYIGFSILECSKVIMYDFYYNELKKSYRNDVHLLYSDTDSLIISLKCENLKSELKTTMNKYIDFSNFPCDHELYSNKRKGELGLLKIENTNDTVLEFVCIKPKVYSLLTNGANIKTIKGVSKSSKMKITHDDYYRCLFEGETLDVCCYHIRKKDGGMFLVKESKTALRLVDDKRYFLENAVDSFAYGHPKIQNEYLSRVENQHVLEREREKQNVNCFGEKSNFKNVFNFKRNNILSVKRKLGEITLCNNIDNDESYRKVEKKRKRTAIRGFICDSATCDIDDSETEKSQSDDCDSDTFINDSDPYS